MSRAILIDNQTVVVAAEGKMRKGQLEDLAGVLSDKTTLAVVPCEMVKIVAGSEEGLHREAPARLPQGMVYCYQKLTSTEFQVYAIPELGRTSRGNRRNHPTPAAATAAARSRQTAATPQPAASKARRTESAPVHRMRKTTAATPETQAARSAQPKEAPPFRGDVAAPESVAIPAVAFPSLSQSRPSARGSKSAGLPSTAPPPWSPSRRGRRGR